MVVETAARRRLTVVDAQHDYAVNGEMFAHPVSGDLTAATLAHMTARVPEQWAPHPPRRVVAAGRLRRPTDPNRVQCLDCPWGLTVHGWDSGADKLAQRHADARGHRVEAVVC